MRSHIVFSGPTAKSDAEAFIGRINKAMGYPNKTTKTWLEKPVPDGKGSFMVPVKDRIMGHMSKDECSGLKSLREMYDAGFLIDPDKPKLSVMQRVMRVVPGYNSDTRPAVKTDLEEPMNWQPWAALTAAMAASAALYYFFG